MSTQTHRTRAWAGEETSTVVQFRTDVGEDEPMVYLHCNIGWVPIGNAPKGEAEAEAYAAKIAEGYDLTEVDEAEARWLAGWED